MSRREERVASTLMKELQTRLARGVQDPRVRGLVTLTRVELVEDMALAKVYFTVLPVEHADLTLHGLRAATRHIRKDVMKRIHMKDMPRIRFVLDEGQVQANAVYALLAQDRAEHENTTARTGWNAEDAEDDSTVSEADTPADSQTELDTQPEPIDPAREDTDADR